MRILAVTNMYPLPEAPTLGIYIEQQITSLRKIGLEVEILFLNRFHDGLGVYFRAARQLSLTAQKFNPDLIHVMYGGVMASLATRSIIDRPTVVTFHGSDLLGDHTDGYLRRLLASYGVWASHQAALRATGIVVVSKQLKESLPRPVNRNKVRIIPCGIDLEVFRPLNREQCQTKLGWSGERFHILFASNFDYPVKRPELAKAAYDTAKGLGLNAEFHYLSGVPYNEVPIWLNASDVLLLTSLHEGSPTVVKEALACRLPIVSVDVGDVRERIQGISECHIALADPLDLAKKLLKVHFLGHRIQGQIDVKELSLQHTAFLLKESYEQIVKSFSSNIRGSFAADLKNSPSASLS